MEINIPIYFRRPKQLEGTSTIYVEEVADVLPSYKLKSYSSGPFQLLGFDTDGLKDPSEVKVLATMLIPKYFDQVVALGPGNAHEIHGHVLISIGVEAQAKSFLEDRAHGSHGCPKLVEMGGMLRYFTFNTMRFYPFIMTDFTVGYYVRDRFTPSNPEEDPMKQDIAIDYPIQYDATLGLYVTRGAHFVA